MSIQERGKAIKSPEEGSSKGFESDIFEEEFDIVPKNNSSGEVPRSKNREIVFVVILVLLTSFLSFFVGRLSLKEGEVKARIYGGIPVSSDTQSVVKEDSQKTEITGAGEVQGTNDGEVVASKSGKKYHYPWCAGAKQIALKNKITFSSIEEARKAGYTPASNCKGLK